jgi:uncharacterized protein YqhQ
LSAQKIEKIYGGQAVIEGVMFGGKHVNVTAVRRKNDEIEFFEAPPTERKHWVQVLNRIPIVRGVVAILESGAKGSTHLNYSMEAYTDDEMTDAEKEEAARKAAEKEEKQGKGGWSLTMMFGVAVAGVISIIFGKIVFTAVPAAMAQFMVGNSIPYWANNLIEGGIKIVFLLAYLWLMTLTPIIKRLFQYHGAEHKVISCYEAGEELTVANVQKYTRLHYRCGSSFIIFTVLVGIILYSFFTWDGYWDRILIRIALLPVVIGLSYEVLRLTNAVRDIPVLRWLGYPGLWLQLLTTKAPNDEQVAVSIASFKYMLERDQAIENMIAEKNATAGATATA